MALEDGLPDPTGERDKLLTLTNWGSQYGAQRYNLDEREASAVLHQRCCDGSLLRGVVALYQRLPDHAGEREQLQQGRCWPESRNLCAAQDLQKYLRKVLHAAERLRTEAFSASLAR